MANSCCEKKSAIRRAQIRIVVHQQNSSHYFSCNSESRAESLLLQNLRFRRGFREYWNGSKPHETASGAEIAALLVSLFSASRRKTAAGLRGVVTDPSGASVPGALVQLRGPGVDQRAQPTPPANMPSTESSPASTRSGSLPKVSP
jgi:hypothetical protein